MDRSAVTDQNGDYRIGHVLSGKYRLSAQAGADDGYECFVVGTGAVEITPSSPSARVDFRHGAPAYVRVNVEPALPDQVVRLVRASDGVLVREDSTNKIGWVFFDCPKEDYVVRLMQGSEIVDEEVVLLAAKESAVPFATEATVGLRAD